MATILIVEDSEGVRELLRSLLTLAGHHALGAPDGATALRRLYGDRPDLVVLDVQLPDFDGWELIDRIRQVSDVPILMCSALRGPDARVRALAAGADDWVGKPFDTRELVARVAALLRRAQAPARQVGGHVFDDGWVKVDIAKYEAVLGERRLDLTPLEFRLLAAFIRHPGGALSHDQLLGLAWEDGLGTREQVKVAVAGLRRKLAAAGGTEATDAIEAVRGVGYRWRGRG